MAANYIQKIPKTIERIASILVYVFLVVFAPWQSNHHAITSILRAREKDEMDRLTAQWQASKMAELRSVSTTSALVAAVIASAFSWYSAPSSPWQTTALWLTGLVFALTALTVATQHSVALTRITGQPNGLLRVRQQLTDQMPFPVGSRSAPVQITARPSYLQMYVWQIPVMFQNFSIVLFHTGLGISVWNTALEKRFDWTEKDIKVALFSSFAAVFAIINYTVSMLSLYHRIAKVNV